MLAYARVLMEVSIDQIFPTEISFVNEKRIFSHKHVYNECKPVKCTECGSIGHNMEECRKKCFEVAQRKLQPKNKWVHKAPQLSHVVSTTVIRKSLATITENLLKDKHVEEPLISY